MLALITVVGTVLIITLPFIKTIPERLRDLHAGAIGVIYTPLVYLAVFPTAFGALMLAEYVPILQWGWLGHNFLVAPILSAGGSPSSTATASTVRLLVTTALWALFVFIVLIAFLIFNYEEEDCWRSSWPHVVAWAVSHLVMGIPLFAVIPIFAAGVVFKTIHDRAGVDVAYATHVTYNTSLFVSLLAILLIL